METKVRMINKITGVPQDVQGSESGDMFIQYGSADYEEITRDGYAFTAITTTATAPVIAVGTTTAGIGLYNSAADGGKSLIIDAVFAICVTTEAALGQASLIYVVGQTRVAALAGGIVIRKANGMGPTTESVALATEGGAILDAVTGVAIGWMPIGSVVYHMVASLVGANLWADVGGRIIVPPGRQFGLTVLEADVTATWNCGVAWHEKLIKLS